MSAMFPVTNCCCFICVRQKNVAIIESFGKFSLKADAGVHCLIPCVQGVASALSLKLRQLSVTCETKTKDNVFVTVEVAVQYEVIDPEAAHYKLTDPASQIRAYVEDVIRGTIPTKTLDETFSSKDQLAVAVTSQLSAKMGEYGYDIRKALVTDLAPDRGVKAAMNEINAQKRLKDASTAKAEGEKILLVKAAEADKEAKYLSGLGVAQQRSAIVNGLKGSITTFSNQVSDSSPKDVMDLLLLTQYFDTLKDIGNNPHSRKTLFVNHGPSAVTQLQAALKNDLMTSGKMER